MSPSAYYHGGPRIAGDLLEPSSTTGQERSGPADGWVYLTPTRSLAVMYAASAHNGWVYEVEPVDPPEQDPGSCMDPGQSVRCRQARILRRYKPSRTELNAAREALRQAEAALGIHLPRR
jgi:hypothetical protein